MMIFFELISIYLWYVPLVTIDKLLIFKLSIEWFVFWGSVMPIENGLLFFWPTHKILPPKLIKALLTLFLIDNF